MSFSAGKLGWLGGALLAGYASLCLLAFLFQRKLLYFPIRWSEEEARRANPAFEDLWIPTPDGERLHGWLWRRDQAPWTVVIFHGNAGNLSHHQAILAPFIALRLQAILFDYRGYGLSSGHPTQQGLLIDGEAVVEYARTSLGVEPDRIVYFGQSLGSGVAALLAGKHPPARLILLSDIPPWRRSPPFTTRFYRCSS
jgi:pimeloyl-ACP methyl ester carboxylesterase